jgi:hypothetical protein
MDVDEQLPTHLWVEAGLRHCSSMGIPAYVMKKGEKMSGMVIHKISDTLGKCKILIRQRDIEGILKWENALPEELVDEAAAQNYINSEIKIDPDIWVIETENKELENIFEL